MLVTAPCDRRKYAIQYYPRSADALHPFGSESHTLNLVWEDIIERLCLSGIARRGTTHVQVIQYHLTLVLHPLIRSEQIFRYIALQYDDLKKYLHWFGEGALRNLNRTSKGQDLPSLEAVHQQPGTGSGPAAAPGEMDNGHLGIQLCSDSQEWYVLLRDYFVPPEAVAPVTPGSTRVFQLASGIPIDLSEDPKARCQRLAILQEIHDEKVEAEAEKQAAIAEKMKKLDDARQQKEQAEEMVQDILQDPDFAALAADHAFGPSPEARQQAVQPTQPRFRAIFTRIADPNKSSASKKHYWRSGEHIWLSFAISWLSYPTDDPAYQAHKTIRDAPMPGVPPLSQTPLIERDVDDNASNDDQNLGESAASVAINAISSRNLISAVDLELVRPLMQQIFRPEYLSALGAGHAHLPQVPPVSEEQSARRSTSPGSSIMIGSQILNKKQDAEEVGERLAASPPSKRRKRQRLDETDGADDAGSRTERPRKQNCRPRKPAAARREKGRREKEQVPAASPSRPRIEQLADVAIPSRSTATNTRTGLQIGGSSNTA